jgi:D-alanyl-D-alanine carboxypeptidase
MNATAARLGMTRTRFANANGLPAPEQITTARDLAKLAAAVVRDYPQYAHMWSLLEARVGKRVLHTHNGLLTNYHGADGPQDRLHLRQRLQRGRQRHPRGPQADRRGAGRAGGAERSVRAASLLEV